MHAVISIVGRLVADPEYRVGKEDREYCTLRLAVNQRLGAQENATFFNCTGNDYIAKRLRKAEFTKGQRIHIVGNLTVREYTDRNGVTRTSVDVGILDWHFVDYKAKDANEAPAAPAQRSPGKISEEIDIPSDDDELPY